MYADQHKDVFPHSYFTGYISREARSRNDPRFLISSRSSGPMRSENITTRNSSTRTPKVDQSAQILLLGRDIVIVYKVRKQHNAPFVQRFDLGWVLLGEICLETHKLSVRSFKINILENRRPCFLTPYQSYFRSREEVSYGGEQQDGFSHTNTQCLTGQRTTIRPLYPSDNLFLKTMDKEFYKDNTAG